MRQLRIAMLGAALLSLLASGSLAAAEPVSARVRAPAYAPTVSGPTTWHVLVGGQSRDPAIQAEGYYPHVITVDAGDTVVWTLNTQEIHSVTFAGTCEAQSCIPPCFSPDTIDIIPCGTPTYDGVSLVESSGRMVSPGYNWDNATPHGGTTYAVTFTTSGVNVYFDLSVSGMRGVVIVNPAGTPYPFTQAQYARQALHELRSDLAAGTRARARWQPLPPSARPDGTRVHYVALGTSPPETARADVDPAGGSSVQGRAVLEGSGIGSAPTPDIAVQIALSGLTPGSVHAVQILPGTCGAPAPTTGLLLNAIFNPVTFTLTSITAGADGRAAATTLLTQPPNVNGPGQLRIPSAGWFINVAAGPTADNGATSVACGNVVFHNAAVLQDLPQSLRVAVGDTVEWTNDTINEIGGVTFLAGQALPQLPEWYETGPSGNPTGYDGSAFLNSGPLYAADAGRTHTFAVTFTRPGSYPYVDVGHAPLGVQGSVVVIPQDGRDH